VNFFKTSILLVVLTGLFIGAGYLVGGQSGMLIALALGIAANVGMYFAGQTMALSMARAEPMPRSFAPWLFEANEKLCQRAGIPVVPLYLSPDPQPNAFACGRGPGKAAVCINQGLIDSMPPREVIGVLAHELSHVKNRDTLTMTIAAAVGSAITYLSYFGLFFGGGSRRDNGWAVLLLWILGPIAAMLIQLAVSRSREYAADASAAQLMNDGSPLADALESLSNQTERIPSATAQPTMAHMYIANPLKGESIASLFSTHPPMNERIRRLRAFNPS